MVIFYKKWKKYNEIQMTKNKMDLNIRKMTNRSLSPKVPISMAIKNVKRVLSTACAWEQQELNKTMKHNEISKKKVNNERNKVGMDS